MMTAETDRRDSHKHLFTPGEWCMRPYCAQFGLTKEQVKSVLRLEDLIMDQYARDCGFDPTESWVMIVRPSGDCDFSPLEPGAPRWCCERADEIRASLGPALAEFPPYAARRVAPGSELDAKLELINSEELLAMSTPTSRWGPGFRDQNPFRNNPFNNTFNNAFPNVFKNRP